MKVIKQETDFGTTVILDGKDKFVRLMLGGDLDLYLSIHNKKPNENYASNDFVITKENYGVYQIFQKLFDDMEDIAADNSEIYDKDNRVITYYSDAADHKVSNILRIKQEADKFSLEFSMQPYIQGYYEDIHSEYYIPIRLSNSKTFNKAFMELYNGLIDTDDIGDIGHQIHIEEYGYRNDQKLVKKI